MHLSSVVLLPVLFFGGLIPDERRSDCYACLVVSCRTIVKLVSANYNKQDESNTIVIHNLGRVLPNVVYGTARRWHVLWDTRDRQTDQ